MDDDTSLTEFARYMRTVAPVEVRDLSDPQDSHKTLVALVPEGFTVQSLTTYLDETLERPRRRKGTATVTDLTSFVDLVNRGKDDQSALFAHRDSTQPKLTGVLNYNETISASDLLKDEFARGRFGDHRVCYAFPLSTEWKAWLGGNGNAMSQADFAAFIENRVMDLIDAPTEKKAPVLEVARKLGGTFATPSEMVTLSRGMSINVNETVSEVQNLQSGESQVNYTEVHTSEKGRPLKVPPLFLISIPVFNKGVPYLIAARLRYRKHETKLVWFYQLYRPEQSFDDAFDIACLKAKDDTNLPLFYGSPEA